VNQEDLSNRFATWPVDRFAGLHWQAGAGGAPLFKDCCASFEVANETIHVAGDHTIFVSRLKNSPKPLISRRFCFMPGNTPISPEIEPGAFCA
jgi:hypothetical protein